MSSNTFSRPRSIESAWSISGYSMRVLSAGDLAEDLPAGPPVDQVVDAGDEEERRDGVVAGQPPGPGLDRQESARTLRLATRTSSGLAFMTAA